MAYLLLIWIIEYHTYEIESQTGETGIAYVVIIGGTIVQKVWMLYECMIGQYSIVW